LPSGPSPFEPLPASLDVLVVEDNAVNQKLAARLLERLGCQVRLASSGPAALRLHSEHRFDLILMDCQMPGMDGYETTSLIRQKETGRRRTPIVAITANAMENDLEKCLEAGMDAYLTKPIDIEKLRETLFAHGERPAPRA
jgi:CheY-like chemotaxis protein